MISMENQENKNFNIFENIKASGLINILAIFTLLIILGTMYALSEIPSSTYLKDADSNLNQLSIASDMLYPLDENTARNLHPFNTNHSLLVSNNLVSYIGLDGTSEQDISIQVSQPLVSTTDDAVLISDLNGFNYYLFDNNGLKLSGRTNSPIIDAEVANNSYFGLILDEPRTKGMVRLFDNNGVHILDYQLRERLKSGFPLALEFSPNSEFLYINIINLDRANISTNIQVINLIELEINHYTNILEGESYPIIESPNNDGIVLLNSNTFFYTDLHEANARIEFNSILDSTRDSETVSFLAKLNEQDPYTLFYVNYNDFLSSSRESLDTSIEVGDNPSSLISNSRNIVVASDNGIYIVPKNSPNNAQFQELGNFEIFEMHFIEDNQLLLICSDGVRLVNI